MALAVLAAGCGSQRASAVPFFGPFAGYTWYGMVRQVSAITVVPTIKHCPGRGIAGTWIGAEGDGNTETQAGPFFQVGVNEECATRNRYYAFWSSTAQHFHPRWLLPVVPGDSVRLSMHADGDSWVMSARDETSNARRTVSVKLPTEPPLNLASWHQEDVTDARTSRPFPYPGLGVVRFSAVRVNDRVPHPKLLKMVWLSTSHEIFGPSQLISGAFSIGPVHPSVAALHYQRLVAREDFPALLFDSRLASWTAETPSRTIKADARSFAHVLRENIAGMRDYRWPANVKPEIGRLVNVTQRVQRFLRDSSGSRLTARETITFLRSHQIGAVSLTIKRKLHLAITDPSALAISQYIKSHSS